MGFALAARGSAEDPAAVEASAAADRSMLRLDHGLDTASTSLRALGHGSQMLRRSTPVSVNTRWK